MFKKKHLPELYTERELNAVEAHIAAYFGEYANVFHELVSPDIHVDICLIEPTPERNYYTLVTMGMGAHRMNVPKELKDKKLERAEVLITLPPDWNVQDGDEKWYWPIRYLKDLARLPGGMDTWIGYGHTVQKQDGEPFAENTKLCCSLVSMPFFFGAQAGTCKLPGGDLVRFYQVIPLYEDEMNFKLKNGAEKLQDLFPEDFNMVVDIARKDVLKQ